MPNVYDNFAVPGLIARFDGAGAMEIGDLEKWQMIEKRKQVREQEGSYQAAAETRGLMGVPIEEITEALQEAARDAWRRHKALGHPIVIWRDGKVVTVPPEEIEV